MKVASRLYHAVFYLLSFLPKKKGLIMFESFNGRQYSDNPRAIHEMMSLMLPGMKMIWSVDRRYVEAFEGRGIVFVKKRTFKWLYCYARAQYWVSNSRMPLWMRKSPSTTYLQTWHGTPLKRLGKDIKEVSMPGTTTEEYIQGFLEEAARWDFLISPNRYSTGVFRRAFNYRGEILECGYPRNDILANELPDDAKDCLKRKLGLPLNKKVILYAPTWRDNSHKGVGHYVLDVKLDTFKFREEFSEDCVILFRGHYLLSNSMKKNFDDFFIDVSLYEDIRDLYLVSDILITDYSSVFFDFGITGKPIIFYMYDLSEYRDSIRGFYFDITSNPPGPIAHNELELFHEIERVLKGEDPYKEHRISFMHDYISLENGQATQKVINALFDK